MLTGDFENRALRQGLHLMGLTSYVSDDVAPRKPLFMKLPDFGVHPAVNELTVSYVPCLIFKDMIVHAGFGAFTENQQLAAIELIVREYEFFSPTFRDF